MKTKNDRAISTIVVAVIVIVIIAAAAGAYYFVSTSGTQTSTSTSTSHSSSSTSTSHSSSSTSSTTTTSAPGTTSSSTSTSQTSSSTSSTTFATSATCTITSQTTTTSDSDTIKSTIVPFFKSVSAMSVNYSGTVAGSSIGWFVSYRVVSTSVSGGVTTYKVNISSTLKTGSTTIPENLTAWVSSNGTVPLLEGTMMGFPIEYNSTTNPTAASWFLDQMTPLTTDTSYVGQMSIYTGSQFTNEGTSSQTFGPTTMQVTTYDVTNPPIDFNVCGTSGHITAFSMQFGTVPNTNPSLTLITDMHMAGTVEGYSMDITIKVTSITTAT